MNSVPPRFKLGFVSMDTNNKSSVNDRDSGGMDGSERGTSPPLDSSMRSTGSGISRKTLDPGEVHPEMGSLVEAFDRVLAFLRDSATRSRKAKSSAQWVMVTLCESIAENLKVVAAKKPSLCEIGTENCATDLLMPEDANLSTDVFRDAVDDPMQANKALRDLDMDDLSQNPASTSGVVPSQPTTIRPKPSVMGFRSDVAFTFSQTGHDVAERIQKEARRKRPLSTGLRSRSTGAGITYSPGSDNENDGASAVGGKRLRPEKQDFPPLPSQGKGQGGGAKAGASTPKVPAERGKTQNKRRESKGEAITPSARGRYSSKVRNAPTSTPSGRKKAAGNQRSTSRPKLGVPNSSRKNRTGKPLQNSVGLKLPPASFTVLVTSTTASLTQLISEVQDRVSFRAGNGKLRKLRQGIALDFKTEAEALTVEAALQGIVGVEVVRPNRLRPRLKLKRVTSGLEEGLVFKLLQSCDESLKTIRKESIAIKRRVKCDNSHEHLILEVDPAVFNSIMKLGWKLDFGMFGIVQVQDSTQPTMCFKCMSYGHIRANCKVEKAVCARCGKQGHETPECRAKAGAQPRCVNCVREKRTQLGHRADDPLCPCRLRCIQTLRYRIDYGQNGA